MSSPACWTCRLRRKKCDRARPICESCANLDIDCHYSAARPDWMDGGRRQAEMTKVVRAQVREGSSSRRDKSFGVQVLPLGQTSSGQSSAAPANSKPDSPPKPVHISTQEEVDDFLLALYLDTVFPSLFPWYQPSSLSGGRSWLLALLKGQKAIRHTAISTGAYYWALSLAKDASHTLRTPCEQYVWDTMAMHMDSSMQIIRQDMNSPSSAKVDVFHQTHLFGSVVQLLIFETTLAKGSDWKMHLTAAVALFNDIFAHHGMKHGRHDLGSVLIAMQQERSMFEGIKLGFSLWTADQAAFQFFSAFLIFADIISSISLGSAPQLGHCYEDLIADDHSCQDEQGLMLQMEDYVGCPGWVLISIGEISRLESWKHSGQYSGCAEELHNQAKGLEKKLQDGLASISGSDPQVKTPSRALVAKMWIHAAILHLTVVVEGWQPSHPTITHHVQSISHLLETIPWHLSLRSIMWPFCVAGCLASQDQEHIFRSAVAAMGPFQAFGTAKQALGLMERLDPLLPDISLYSISNMTVVAVAGGSGHVGRAIVETLAQSPSLNVIVLGRKPSSDKTDGSIHLVVDYTNVNTLANVLKQHDVHTVISTIQVANEEASSSEVNLIKAAAQASVQRFIVSGWGSLPSEMSPTSAFQRASVEQLRSTALEWTRFAVGYFLDCYGLDLKTHIPPLSLAIDIANKKAAIPGTGNEPIAFTYSYCYGEKSTWNGFLKVAEQVTGASFDTTYDSLEKLQKGEMTELPTHKAELAKSPFPAELTRQLLALLGMWSVAGQFDIPIEGSLNSKYPHIKPLTIREALRQRM
ncbi:C6 zink-finger PRO1A [Fusarium albosuccineum]|uniref:C6 zink-finger PRO1A n=1 Tax=Fusarium albosuccineum TaxID=1237068 RepID=A0A8H4L021_9HYPO|nr:C6 zink-finger PRO1A [Fusarium albosuccineum]